MLPAFPNRRTAVRPIDRMKACEVVRHSQEDDCQDIKISITGSLQKSTNASLRAVRDDFCEPVSHSRKRERTITLSSDEEIGEVDEHDREIFDIQSADDSMSSASDPMSLPSSPGLMARESSSSRGDNNCSPGASVSSPDITSLPTKTDDPNYVDVVDMKVFERLKERQMEVVSQPNDYPDDELVVDPRSKGEYHVVRIMEKLHSSELPSSAPDEPNCYSNLMNDKRCGDLYIVHWFGYNFTDASAKQLSDLKGSTELLKQLDHKNAGLKAIIELDIANRSLFANKNVIHHLPNPRDVTKLNNAHITKLRRSPEGLPDKYGYWSLKAIELDWLKVLDENGDGGRYKPLYLEAWDLKALDHLPTFKFILKLGFSKEAEEQYKSFVDAMLKSRHDERKQLLNKKKHVHAAGSCFCECRGVCEECSDMEGNTLCTVKNGFLEVVQQGTSPEATRFAYCCGPRQCDCSIGCPHQATFLAGRQYTLAVFWEQHIDGWGVRTLDDIPKNSYITEYVGEVIPYKESLRLDVTYQFPLPGDRFVIDSRLRGNESRFISHSCDPNCVAVRIFSEGQGDYFCHVGIFALRDIRRGDQLTTDYSPHVELKKTAKGKTMECRCGTAACRGYLLC